MGDLYKHIIEIAIHFLGFFLIFYCIEKGRNEQCKIDLFSKQFFINGLLIIISVILLRIDII